MAVRFLVDGNFYDHPKTVGMSDSAMALWTRAGSYCAAKSPDGFVPAGALPALSQAPMEASGELVSRGLWERRSGGFSFICTERRSLFKFTQRGARPWIPSWLRRAVYERDGHRCLECGASQPLSLDHIKPWSRGGQDTLENLRTLCLPCNWSRGVGA